jgi:hypothetical protein
MRFILNSDEMMKAGAGCELGLRKLDNGWAMNILDGTHGSSRFVPDSRKHDAASSILKPYSEGNGNAEGNFRKKKKSPFIFYGARCAESCNRLAYERRHERMTVCALRMIYPNT